MHAVHPHLFRPLVITLLAAVAAIALSLALAPRLGDLQLGGNQTTPAVRENPTIVAPRGSPWLDPFAPPVLHAVTLPWRTGS